MRIKSYVTPGYDRQRAKCNLEDEKSKLLAYKIDAYKDIRGISMKNMAKEVGISYNNLYNWRSGEFAPSKKMLIKLVLAGVISEEDSKNWEG